jgi:hypothetical protein
MQAFPTVIRKSSAHNGNNILVVIACNEPTDLIGECVPA